MDAEAFHLVVHEERLPNGMRVVCHPDPRAGRVLAGVGFGVGAGEDPPDQQGLAHLIEHLVFRVDGFERRLAAVGGTSNGWTDHDRTVLWAAAPIAALDLVVRWAGWEVMRGEWGDGEVEGERQVVATEQAGLVDRAHARDRERVASILWGEHPYGRSVHGVPTSTAEATRAFRREWYTPAHATLVVAGAVDPEVAMATIRRVVWDEGWATLDGDVQGATLASEAPPPPAVAAPPQRIWLPDDVGDTSLLAAWRTVSQSDVVRPAFDILAALIGAETANARWGGSFLIVGERPRDLARARRRLLLPYASTQLDDVRADMALRWARALDGVVGRAQSLLTCELATGEPDCLPAEWAGYAAVTPDDVAAVAARLRPEPDVLLAVVPASVGRAPLPRMDRW